MRLSRACIACSGSVSLELMYNLIPTIIVYRVTRSGHFLANLLVCVRYVTLVNLLWTPQVERKGYEAPDPDAADAEPVPFPEYVTIENPGERVGQRMLNWLKTPAEWESKRSQLVELKSKYAQLGATQRAAQILLELFSETSDLGTAPSAKAA